MSSPASLSSGLSTHLPDALPVEKPAPPVNPQALNKVLEGALSYGSNLDRVKELIAQGADVNTRYTDNRGHDLQTPLRLAQEKNDRRAVIDFIKKGADINRSYRYFVDTPCLNWAINNDDWEIAQLAIEHGADLNEEFERQTPLCRVITKGNAHLARLLIEKGACLEGEPTYGRSGFDATYNPLFCALNAGLDDIVCLLIEKKVDLNKEDGQGRTPLHVAIENKKTAIAKLLILNKAKLRAETRDDLSIPLHYALESENVEIVNLLVERKAFFLDTKNPTSRQQSVDLISGGGRGGRSQKPVLQPAITKGFDEVAELMINSGIDLNLQDNHNKSALDRAIEKKNHKMARLLISKGAKTHLDSKYNFPALFSIVKNGDPDLVKFTFNTVESILNTPSSNERLIPLRPLLVELSHYSNPRERSKIVDSIYRNFDLMVKNHSLDQNDNEKRDFPLAVFKMAMEKEKALRGASEGEDSPSRVAVCSYLIGMIVYKKITLEEIEPLIDSLVNHVDLTNNTHYELILSTIYKLYTLENQRGITTLEKMEKEGRITFEEFESLICASDKFSQSSWNYDSHFDCNNNDHYEYVFPEIYNSCQAGEEIAFTTLKKLIESFKDPKKGFKAFSLIRTLMPLDRDCSDKLRRFASTEEHPVTFLKNELLNTFKELIVNPLEGNSDSTWINLYGIEDLEEKLQSVLKSSKKFKQIKDAILCVEYLSRKIFSLPAENEFILRALSVYIQDVLEGKLVEKRFDLTKSPHLKAVFGEGDAGRSLLEKWKENTVLPADDVKDSHVSHLGYTACISNTPNDLLASEHQVEYDLSLHISPQHNISNLPTPLLDGKYNLIAVKNNEGKMVAACFLVILWDEKEKAPVLFQEPVRIHASENKEYCMALMDEMCRKKAEEMSLRLLRLPRERESGVVYPNPIKSLAGRCSFRFQDKDSKEQRTNVYTLNDSLIIWGQ